MSGKCEKVRLSQLRFGFRFDGIQCHAFYGLACILLQKGDLDNDGELLFADGKSASECFQIFGALTHRVAEINEHYLVFAMIDERMQIAPENRFF